MENHESNPFANFTKSRRQILSISALAGFGSSLTIGDGLSQEDLENSDEDYSGFELFREMADFVEDSVSEELLIDRESVSNRWDLAGDLARRVIEFQRETFGVSYMIPELEQRFEPTYDGYDLQQFEEGEERIANELEPSQNSEDPIYRLVVAKLLKVIGADEIAEAVYDLLRQRKLIVPLVDAVRERNWTLVAARTNRVLATVFSRSFIRDLIRIVGRERATVMLVRIGGRFAPYVGWVMITASLVLTIREQTQDA